MPRSLHSKPITKSISITQTRQIGRLRCQAFRQICSMRTYSTDYTAHGEFLFCDAKPFDFRTLCSEAVHAYSSSSASPWPPCRNEKTTTRGRVCAFRVKRKLYVSNRSLRMQSRATLTRNYRVPISNENDCASPLPYGLTRCRIVNFRPTTDCVYLVVRSGPCRKKKRFCRYYMRLAKTSADNSLPRLRAGAFSEFGRFGSPDNLIAIACGPRRHGRFDLIVCVNEIDVRPYYGRQSFVAIQLASSEPF